MIPEKAFPKAPAHVAPYVEVLGPELTVAFLLSFGGAELGLSKNPTERSSLAALVGFDKARQLKEIEHRVQRRVPLAKPWIAACLRARGRSTAEIARTLRVSDVSVRRWLKD